MKVRASALMATLPSLLAGLLLLGICHALPAQGEPKPWKGPKKFSTVRFYLYGLEEDRGPVLVDGKLDSTVVNPEGILLSPAQVDSLFLAINQPPGRYRSGGYDCMMMRYGFVFHDKKGRPVGHYSLSLKCWQHAFSPEHAGTQPDVDRLERLITSLGVPVYHTKKNSTAYAKAIRANGGKLPALGPGGFKPPKIEVHYPSTMVGAPPPPVWQLGPFAYVKVYLFGLESEPEEVMRNGVLDPSVVDTAGILLSAEQVKRLMAAISPPDYRHVTEPNMCHVPHHGFVFYAADGSPVAHISPCMMCKTYSATPDQDLLPNYDAFDKLLKELGLPIYRSPRDWEDYAKELRGEK